MERGRAGERGIAHVGVVWLLAAAALAAGGVHFVIDGQFLVGVGALVGASVAAWNSFRNTQEIRGVKKEVTTSNAQSIAQLADAAETLRIHTKAAKGLPLTPEEQGHIDSVSSAGRPKEEKEK